MVSSLAPLTTVLLLSSALMASCRHIKHRRQRSLYGSSVSKTVEPDTPFKVVDVVATNVAVISSDNGKIVFVILDDEEPTVIDIHFRIEKSVSLMYANLKIRLESDDGYPEEESHHFSRLNYFCSYGDRNLVCKKSDEGHSIEGLQLPTTWRAAFKNKLSKLTLTLTSSDGDVLFSFSMLAKFIG